MARQLAITKRTLLDGFDGWDKDCYVDWRPLTYADHFELKRKQDTEDEEEAFKAILEFTRKQILRGKVKILGDDGEPMLADYEAEDLDNMPPDLVDRIFSDITGVKFEDPKDLPTAQASSDGPNKPESTTETS